MKIKNNSTYVNASGMQKATFNFYTNDDAEMKLRHENEWYQRIYWQGVETFNKHGYVIFDTFTYDDDHLPRLKHYFPEEILVGKDDKSFANYGCFNRNHFPKFMKDLRSDLASAGFDVKNNVKYVYTTEYGSDRVYEDRRGTHVATMRPHYHLMLFVTDPTLTPVELNEYIGKHWFYGFHGNGKSPAELKRNTFHCGMNATDTKVRLRGLANYIGKYMHKDADYEQVIGSRIDAIAYKLCPPQSLYAEKADTPSGRVKARLAFRSKVLDIQRKLKHLQNIGDFENYEKLCKIYGFEIGKAVKLKFETEEEWREAFNTCRKDVAHKLSTFHGQSQHFGEYALQEPDFNIKEVAETGKMRMPDKQKVVKFIPIPLYYRRKLFYEQVMKDDGKLMWKLKDDDLSRTYYKNATYRQAAVLSSIYTNVYNSLEVADRIKVDSWMKGRTMNDLASYEVFFKDCFFDCDLTDITTDDVLDIRLSQDFTQIGLNGNQTNPSSRTYKKITQSFREDFKHFDDVLDIFDSYMFKRHEDLNDTFDKKTELRKKFNITK